MITTTEPFPPRLGEVGRARASVAAIETLAAIRREGRGVATDTERDVLAGWSGWGPLAKTFAPDSDTWGELSDRIRAALPADDVELGSRGTHMAFYTPEPIAHAMWTVLGRLGFTGGRVLEPGCGGGVFMHTAPAGAVMTGVERDTTAADICRLLNPGRTVIGQEFQSARLVDGYAAAIGNVPFADTKVYDPNAPREVTQSLHDYFIWRTVKLLAPGGIAVLLTSRYTMDKTGDMARYAIGKLADLIGAVRLPNDALAAGGTGVLADVLVLRRREHGEHRARGFGWQRVDHTTYGYKNQVNAYWNECPDMVLGDMAATGRGQYGMTIEVVPRDGDPAPEVLLARAGDRLAEVAAERDLGWVEPVDVGAPPSVDGLATDEGWHNGSLRVVDGDLFRVEGGRLAPVDRPSQELRDLLALRDLAVRLVGYEADHGMGDALIEPLRADTARAYRAYVRKYGALNRSTLVEGKPDPETGMPTYTRRLPRVMSVFRRDPDAALVAALEVFDDETQEAGPAPILSTRQNRPAVRPTSTTDPKQALAWCLNHRAGTVDLDHIADLLAVDVERVPDLLGDAVFQDPATRTWVTAEEYLSGDVRTKLDTAQLSAAVLPQFQRNVDGLTAVLPPWLGPGEIGVNLGAPWISTADVERFIRELLDYRFVTVRRVPQTAQWEVDPGSRSARGLAVAIADWGTPDVDAFRLVELALNGKVPVVHRTVVIGGEERERKDPDASLAASEKQARIKERFAEWLWEDGERTDRLVEHFNRRYNCLVARRFSGEHITVDGLAPWFADKVYPHQKEWAARAIATPAVLCGLPVGSGKTAMMAMTAMKLRQLGLARKPMAVVPNHLLEQIDREFRQLFPAARILSASAATIAEGRRGFNAKVATQEWDIILVTHSAFDRVAVAPQTEAAYIAEMIAELEAALLDAAPDGEMSGRMVKTLAKNKERLHERLKELRDRAAGFDLGVTFESMGVDYLLIDEAHYYKNLAVPVRTDGFSVRPSKRATGLEIKLRYLKGRGCGRYAALFTGTPVSNTMLELYVVLRYLMQDYLRTVDLGTADAWAATFVRFVTSVDVTIDGGQFRLVTKPAEFVNAPELRMLLSQCADVRTADQLGLKRPEYTIETVVIEPTAAQQEYSADLVERAERVKERGPFGRAEPDDPHARDNMLAICGDGRRMATDPKLVGLDDDAPAKLAAVAANMLRIWRADPTCLQIGFCDVGTPNPDKGPQTYGRLRNLLIEGGMPRGLVRFIHDAKSDGDKAALFADCRAEGKVAVILGSTDKLGVGTNIQRRVAAMHHVDAPWRPADVEQRDGRGLRPGNRYKLVRVYRYVVERTFDAYSWQLLTRKIGFISQVVSGQVDRTVEDITADVVDSYAAVKAAATGQPLLLEKAKIEAEVKRLRGIQKGHHAATGRLHRDIDRRNADIRKNTREAEAWEAIAAAAGDVEPLDDDTGAALHEYVKGWRTYWRSRDAKVFSGVQVALESWRTLGDEPATHPKIRVRGHDGADWMEIRAYSYWTPQNLAKEFVRLLRKAAGEARFLRGLIAKAQTDNALAATSAARPFTEADQLTAALARLDQINAALHAAALNDPKDQDAPPGAVPAQRDRPAQELAAVAPERVDDDAPAPAPAPVSEQVADTAAENLAAAVDKILAGAVDSGRVVIAHIGPPAKTGADTDEDEDDNLDDVADLFGELMEEYDALTVSVFADLMAE